MSCRGSAAPISRESWGGASVNGSAGPSGRRHDMTTRKETDSMGAIEVPEDRNWGAQPQRSLEHFKIAGERFPPEMIRAFGQLKRACAEVNVELGLLPKDIAGAIVAAA